MNNNIFRCRICGRFGMAEEQDLHECRALKDYKFEKDVIRVFDGTTWYPLNLEQVRRDLVEEKCHKRLSGPKSNRKFTDDRDTEKFTECVLGFCGVLGENSRFSSC